jgi:hypothetical protein
MGLGTPHERIDLEPEGNITSVSVAALCAIEFEHERFGEHGEDPMEILPRSAGLHLDISLAQPLADVVAEEDQDIAEHSLGVLVIREGG